MPDEEVHTVELSGQGGIGVEMALKVMKNGGLRCPIESSDRGTSYCYPHFCALGRSLKAGDGVTEWYCALNAPADSEPNCYVKKRD